MSKNFRAFTAASDPDFFRDLIGVVSEAGLAGDDALAFLLLSGLIDLFLDLFFVDVVTAVPGVTFPSWLCENRFISFPNLFGVSKAYCNVLQTCGVPGMDDGIANALGGGAFKTYEMKL